MKRAGFLFDAVCDFGSLHNAYRRAFQGSGGSEGACRFCFHLETELVRLQQELKTGSYHPKPYRYFDIFDPKERTISVAPFRDRVVHHAVVAVLEPVFEPTFIHDSYATRKGKGTHRALRRAQRFMGRNRFYLKVDVAKFFNSVDHDILLSLVGRKIKDRRLMALVERIVRNTDRGSGLEAGKGLPIGNLTSQFFANVYLNPLDHFIKEEQGARAYIRYMDDMVLFDDGKVVLKESLKALEAFLENRLGLRLNPAATRLNTRLHGLSYLGFRVFPKHLRVNKENLKRLTKRLEKKRAMLDAGQLAEAAYVEGVRSMIAHLAFADSLRLRQRMGLSRAGAV